ncbi:fasciclin-1 isoform X1 [Vespa velutina]|uniref:fasciclin-1 isoform X5 n=2 Tax=Vespa TaxID=7443 RepID=UPI001EFFA708|nr:fasciclin-1 isoform X5 [Vespa crabro]XP_047365591.1 fasciclin-1 isoform X1 [Vespa velutina]XP_047365592.1 fasciclin-1 isoform X1 [Vespa velutina]XP_047365593.1 fasciclin-1 isoform X1 [Vespa velutina]XP_047365594.1 fasciclin-1 isoform X1 [Vespa velutina]XP_047365595.1 fasciclin-1 isoform X1 [Vespa velutina]XP_047365596.1 fasciclin-1 isoform X1 [Vespa velutina]XP_047365597.1 fasciclin-1 isoform X1 [Vespa velutina]
MMAAFFFAVFVALVLSDGTTGTTASQMTMEARIYDDADLSQFYQLLETSQVANNTLTYRHVTVFAPTNRAFQKYNGSKSNLVLYHMSNLPLTIERLGLSVSSELDGNPPLWVTRRPGPTGEEEVFINNAKILKQHSNFQSKIKVNGDTKTQVLHVIDEVLEPVRSISPESPIYNPDAFQFINQSENFNMGNHRVRTFRQRIVIEKKEGIFTADGRYTFFIPVDEGFKPEPRPQKVDHLVIDGHVIPNHILFTVPTPENVYYETLVFSDNLKVTVSFLMEHNKVYVKSNTIVGDASHHTGVVLAEIVKPNIPVRNGVIHLIQRPLMVIDSTVKDFLEEKEDGPVYKFYETIRDFGDDIMTTISRLHDVTLFAPSNAALEEPGVQHILQDKRRVKEILNLHYVKQRLPLEKIQNKSISQAQAGIPTAADRKKLYFNVVQGPAGNQTITVEGGGVNATVVTANIAATNGIIHIIDRVLGVPYTTVFDKLRTDPMLNSTYFLGQRRGFNEQLNDTTKRFTYFAPREQAWSGANISYPSTIKKLFMQDFSYHTKQILERHLVVADQVYTMAKLREMSINDSVTLTSARDTLKLRVKELTEIRLGDDENSINPVIFGYQIEWEGKWIRVFRHDVECTNGIIHVIDGVFLKDSDVRVTGDASLASFAPHLIIFLIAKWLL